MHWLHTLKGMCQKLGTLQPWLKGPVIFEHPVNTAPLSAMSVDLGHCFVSLNFVLFCLKIYLFYVHCCCLQTHLKRASDPIRDGCQLPCGCWDLNSGPLEEQSVLLTTEPRLQPRKFLSSKLFWFDGWHSVFLLNEFFFYLTHFIHYKHSKILTI